jgi:hypothetical protein
MGALMDMRRQELVWSALRRLQGSRTIPSEAADIARDEAIGDLREAVGLDRYPQQEDPQ